MWEKSGIIYNITHNQPTSYVIREIEKLFSLYRDITENDNNGHEVFFHHRGNVIKIW